MENIKWGRIVVWSVIGLIILVGAPILYVTVRMVMLGFQGGTPDAEAQKAFSSGPAILVVILLAAALSGFLGGRGSARKAEGSYLLNGVLAGVLITVFYVVYSLIGGGFSFWMLAVAALAIAFAAFGGWVGGRGAEAEAYA